MDLDQAKLILDKMNTMFKSISMDQDEPSSIEKDLMLSYTRQFYETFLDLGNTPTPAKKHRAKPKRKLSTPTPPPPPIVEIPESIKQMEKEVPTPPPTPKHKPEPKKVATPPPPPIQPKKATPAKYKSLFKLGTTKELSDKLSLRPITDLTKALAINDRLLYANALFNKDQNELTFALDRLNKTANWDEAQSALVSYAEQNNWLDEEAKEVAQDFIKLTRRKFM